MPLIYVKLYMYQVKVGNAFQHRIVAVAFFLVSIFR
jgi:hypothetical protein